MRRWSGVAAIGGVALVAMLLPGRAALAWGPEGHRVIALLADRLLQQSDQAAQAKLAALLATDKGNKLTKNDIAGEAVWADVLREKSEEARDATSAWHSTRLNRDNPDPAAACFGHKPLPEGYPASHGPRDNCSVDKIVQFTAELKNPETTPFERLAAVQFLLNLVGDLHDPLHAIDAGDQGGNCTALQIPGKPPVRLAAYWDTTLVSQVVGPDPARGASRLLAGIAPSDAKTWGAGDPAAWARESYDVAKGVAYGFGEQPASKANPPAGKGENPSCTSVALYNIGADYEAKALAAVKTQIEKAGVRLARVLRDGLH